MSDDWPKIQAERRGVRRPVRVADARTVGERLLVRRLDRARRGAGTSIASTRQSPAVFFSRLAKAGFSFDKMVDDRRQALSARRDPASFAAAMRCRRALRRNHPPGPVTAMLGEMVVHGEDIRRPLGLSRDYPGGDPRCGGRVLQGLEPAHRCKTAHLRAPPQGQRRLVAERRRPGGDAGRLASLVAGDDRPAGRLTRSCPAKGVATLAGPAGAARPRRERRRKRLGLKASCPPRAPAPRPRDDGAPPRASRSSREARGRRPRRRRGSPGRRWPPWPPRAPRACRTDRASPRRTGTAP